MKAKAFAKINLGLNLGDKLNNNKHELESIILPISLSDKITIRKSKNFSVKSNVNIENNILNKVLEYFIKEYRIKPVKIKLIKKIPIASGLGGGSSDASLLINLLNSFFKLNLDNKKLEEIAKLFGSDTVFSLYNKPSYVFYDGTKLEKLNKSYNKKVIIITPLKKVLSHDMFQKIEYKKISKIDYRLYIDDFSSYYKNATNDFLDIILKDDEIKNIYNCLFNISKGIKLSGSGASFYLIGYSKLERKNIIDKMKKYNVVVNLCKLV